MSTCSTATSTHRGNESRCHHHPPSSEAVRGRLEMQLQDLKRHWDAYKTGRSGAPRHRRSRSASSLPSAVTVVEPDGFHLSLLRRSPRARRLVSSLQQTVSADVAAAGPCDDEDASSICSVEGGYSVATNSSSCSCSCRQCAVVLCCGYSTSSSCIGTTVAPFSSDINGGCARKMDEGKWAASSAVWIPATAIALVVVGFVAMVIFVLGVDDGRIGYQVPT